MTVYPEAKLKMSIRAVVEVYEELAEDMASAQRAHFEALVHEGFTEEQAMELVKEAEVNANA